MKNMAGLILLAVIFSSQPVLASHTAMIGGLRSGLGLGAETDRQLGPVAARFGVEAATGEDLLPAGDNPFIIFAGLKLPLLTLGGRPVDWSFGFIGNYGNRTEQGEYFSLLFEKLGGNEAAFLETGLDWFGDHGHVQAQLGFRFLAD
ncbi:MAG: hypothetical protein JW873_06790 [Candidatus Saganbacteria bacterium]|nr:hypothetical protein [Candidatus Saganbacteria bacterium]